MQDQHDQNTIKIHKHIAFLNVNEHVIAWNRFYPTVVQFEKRDFDEILDLVERKRKRKEYSEEFLTDMEKNNILSKPGIQVDKKFRKAIQDYFQTSQHKQVQTIHDKKPFDSIQFINEKCNLKCSYCIMKHTWGSAGNKHKKNRFSFNETWDKVQNIIDRQYKAMKEHNIKKVSFFLNGGEFLLHYKLVEKIVSYIRKTKEDSNSSIGLNTNATLLNDERIRFLKKNKVKIFISIDANKEHHDTTRIYHNNKGSFEDIKKNYQLLKKNKYTIEKSHQVFQGTIDNIDLIEKEKIFQMSDWGFKSARMGPNLINISKEEARQKAKLVFDLCMESYQNKKLLFTDTFFDLCHEIYNSINGENPYLPFPYCVGLSSLGNHRLIYNIDADTYSYLCQFIYNAAAKLEDSNEIFSEKLVEKSLNFQKERAKVLFRECWQCPIIGVCKGGCIIYGLSADNKINRSACEYSKTMWALYALETYKRETKNKSTLRPKSRSLGTAV